MESFLRFIGIGGAFNTTMGNNSAFVKRKETLFLIDCGENVFTEIQDTNVLKDVKKVYILITHFHDDHCGSLGSMIAYLHFKLKIKPVILYPNVDDMKQYLKFKLVHESWYEIEIAHGVWDTADFGKIHVDPVVNPHVPNVECFGYRLTIDKKNIYYSGDTNTIKDYVIQLLEHGKIDYFYQDVCTHDCEENVHLSYRKLKELVKPEFRSKVFLMHLDKEFDIYQAEEAGFNVVDLDMFLD